MDKKTSYFQLASQEEREKKVRLVRVLSATEYLGFYLFYRLTSLKCWSKSWEVWRKMRSVYFRLESKEVETK